MPDVLCVAVAEGEWFFVINSTTGQLSVNSSLLGQAGLYNYTLTVTDHGSPPLTANNSLVMEILDQNIHAPQFTANYSQVNVGEVGTTLPSSLFLVFQASSQWFTL
jgi:hypothetical protein